MTLDPAPLSPVSRLLSADQVLPAPLRAEILSLEPTAVPALLELLEDEALWSADAPGAGWAPVHVVELLGELQATEAVQPLLRVLATTDWNDLLHDAVIRVLPSLGAAVLEPALAAYKASSDEDFRHALLAVLSELGVHDDRVFGLLIAELPHDPSRVAGNLAAYGDVRALEHLQRAFDTNDEDLSRQILAVSALVELRDAIERLGGSLTPAQQAKYARGLAAGERWRRRLATAAQVDHVPVEGLGRNDPCWCGSGKKFKKCHL